MAYTAAEIEARISALESGLARGERTVQFADRSTTYASSDELIERVNYYKGLLRNLTSTRPKQTVLLGDKGL